MPYESDSGEKKNYTEDEMLEYMLNEVKSPEEAKALLAEHGFSLSRSGMPMMEEEMMEESAEDSSLSEEDMAEESMSELPPPASMGLPRVNIVELRMNAAKKAVGDKKKSNSKGA